MLSSRDGSTWTETRVSSASFDISQAPLTGAGFFLGDYHGLVSAGTTVLPVSAATTGSADNPTDVFTLRLVGIGTTGAAFAARGAEPLMTAGEDAALRREHSTSTRQALERRLPGWEARGAARARPLDGLSR